MSLPDRMQQALDDAKMTKAQLARALDASPQAVNGWFKTGRVSKENLVAFTKVTGSNLEWLIGGDADLAPEDGEPTEMGRRILMYMSANALTDRDEFANTIGLTRERFNAWLYVEQKDVEVRPLLRAADALSTNAEYLLGDTDDSRAVTSLGFREHQLLTAYRDLSEDKQDLLLQTATAWHEQTEAAPSASSPFRIPSPK